MSLSALTLTQLRYLIAVDEQRSFRAAAQSCHVSQPALSVQIQKLEELLGVSVFDRSKKPIVPTDIGAQILRQARVVAREAERLEELARRSQPERARYRLGVIPTLTTTLLRRLLPAFHEAHPGVQLIVEELQTELLIRKLADDGLDGGLAATPLGVPGIQEEKLFEERFYAYLPQGHPLAERREVRQSDLVEQPLWLLAEGHCFRNQVLHLCRAHRAANSSLPIAFEGNGFEALTGLVEQGLGVTLVPELMVEDLSITRRQLHVRPFASPSPAREISLVYARSALRRDLADSIAALVRQSLPADTRTLDPAARQLLSPSPDYS